VDEGHRDDVGIRNEEDDGNAIEKDLVDVTLRNEDDDSDTRDPADDNVITSANEAENSPIQRKLSCSNQSQLSISQRLAKASRYSEFKDMNSTPDVALCEVSTEKSPTRQTCFYSQEPRLSIYERFAKASRSSDVKDTVGTIDRKAACEVLVSTQQASFRSHDSRLSVSQRLAKASRYSDVKERHRASLDVVHMDTPNVSPANDVKEQCHASFAGQLIPDNQSTSTHTNIKEQNLTALEEEHSIGNQNSMPSNFVPHVEVAECKMNTSDDVWIDDPEEIEHSEPPHNEEHTPDAALLDLNSFVSQDSSGGALGTHYTPSEENVEAVEETIDRYTVSFNQSENTEKQGLAYSARNPEVVTSCNMFPVMKVLANMVFGAEPKIEPIECLHSITSIEINNSTSTEISSFKI
jgi:hypothetical protein